MRRLYVRIYLHFLLILLVVWSTTGLVLFRGARNVIVREFPGRIGAHVANLVAPVWSDPARREAEVAKVSEDLALDVTLRGADGSELSVRGNELPAPDARELKEAEAGPLVSHGPGRLVMIAPVRDPADGRLLGFAQSTHHGELHLHWPARNLLALAVVLAVVGLVAFPLARRISRPVEQLTDASRRLGGGDLSYRIEESKRGPPNELAELIHAWNEMAERVEGHVRAQKELLANVSHELRSPLARIRVALELLPQDAILGDVLVDLAELDRLIEEVLTAARLEAGALPLRSTSIDLDELFGAVLERAKVDPVTAGKEVRAERSGVSLQADGALLKRALWNLVENAAKYGAPPIVLGASRQEGGVTIRVEDHGPGIDPADLPNVFEPFYRADKARTPMPGSRSMGGFGLGLTLTRRIVEAHGGTIRAEPASPGGRPEGCRMLIALPATPSPAVP